ncbi:stromal cell-derived factor 2 [Callorhinchus milii]|uniref:Stromal cell-derived factor 2-like protein n=1 Tax=Callorhinchus milii TaxID=7868 RepID=V9L721_CALMI|nr:stromal cell-derived factor 2 [Callorhinchus milii]|eukprot:gi/632958086/ref/XP_007894835.1/ PREDICTED: stromal cell-derived factor 2 [Callorhinchus milii]
MCGRGRRVAVALLRLWLLLAAGAGAGAWASELSYVTCGSVVKLLNTRHNVRLHSHEVKYGSGSGQQSVTGVTTADDSNSYWRIRGKMDDSCQRGNPVKCGEVIRMTHINTGRNLHSHYFTSPLSGNQEVSAFGEDGNGDDLDNWTVVCSGTFWERENPVKFKHTATEVLLSVTGEQYGRPINGQREVHGMAYSNQYSSWKVMEGIFMKPMEMPRFETHSHSEL